MPNAENDAPECNHVEGYYNNPHSTYLCWDCGAWVDQESVIPPEGGHDA